jgi:hypothetical protein
MVLYPRKYNSLMTLLVKIFHYTLAIKTPVLAHAVRTNAETTFCKKLSTLHTAKMELL